MARREADQPAFPDGATLRGNGRNGAQSRPNEILFSREVRQDRTFAARLLPVSPADLDHRLHHKPHGGAAGPIRSLAGFEMRLALGGQETAAGQGVAIDCAQL